MRDGFRDLIVALGDVRRAEDIADVAHLERLTQVDPELEVIGRVQRRNAANALWTEARAGAIGSPDVERDAQKRNVVLADLAHVFEIRRFEKRVDAGPVRQLAPLEATDLGFVFDGVHAFETELLAAADFFLPLAVRDGVLFLQGAHAFELAEVWERPRVFAVVGRVAFVKGHWSIGQAETASGRSRTCAARSTGSVADSTWRMRRAMSSSCDSKFVSGTERSSATDDP